MSKPSLHTGRPALLAAALAVAILALDLLMPEGMGVSFLYVVVIIVALWSPWERFALAAALGVTALAAAEFLLSRGSLTGSPSALPSVLAAAAVWATAFLVHRHKIVEQTLIREEAEAQAYLDVAGVTIVVLDREGRVSLINRRGCELLGLEAQQVLGRPWVDSFVSENDRERTRHALKQLVRGEQAPDRRRKFENLMLTSSGEERLVAWRRTVLRDARGEVRATVGSGEDITERRAAEKRLRAQESLAKVGQLAAIVAHEVRNPLAGIRGAIQILSRRIPEGEDRKIMDRIVERVDALNALTEDLLVFARPHTPELASVRLEAVLGAAQRLLAGHADLAAVAVEIKGGDVGLQADEKMLQDVFLNLFLNAAQAMKGEGAIRVAIRVDAGTVHVDVEDDGPGIPPNDQERLFEPFFTTRHRGTGLGLPIVKRDVEAHGGDVAITFPEEGGTRVTVSLPLERRPTS